jgi:hypothetical protein
MHENHTHCPAVHPDFAEPDFCRGGPGDPAIGFHGTESGTRLHSRATSDNAGAGHGDHARCTRHGEG